MTRIKPIEPSKAREKTRELLENVKKQMGVVPNLLKGFAHSPAALEFYLSQSQALGGGVLDARLREQIALAMAGFNGCDYCASAHTFLGKKAGVPAAELVDNLDGRSGDEKTSAALVFVQTVAATRGHLDDADIQRVRDAGFSEAEIVEMIAHVSINVFTNYFNNVAHTEIDFPRVDATRKASAA
jgi:uncharacterized peroxidase-related enzyme